jgi:hypothetical protein
MADIAHPEGVDGLPVVAHGKQVAVFEQQGGDILVQVVGVLVLVAQDIPELRPGSAAG